jgi:N-acetylglucosamine-6-phosphate deacetylase
MNYLIINGKILLEDKILYDHIIVVNNNIISEIIENSPSVLLNFEHYEVIDAKFGFICPGLIETHIHGCSTYDFASMAPSDYKKVKYFLAAYGINIFLPTFQYSKLYLKNLLKALKYESKLLESIPGFYLEGPFINKEKRGGILEKNILKPNLKLLDDIIRNNRGLLKIMTLAPEIENAELIIKKLIDNDIIPALGHSNCLLSDTKSLEKYSSKISITHLYNAMSGISHKLSGLGMYPFLNRDCFFELNGDSIHLSDEIIKLSYDYLNRDKLILISDAVISAGEDFGEWEYCGIPVLSDKTGVRYKGSKVLIGSNKLLPEIILNFIKITGAPIYEAVKFATINPARLLGLDNSLGSIEIGKTSNLVIFDEAFQVIRNLNAY